MMNEEEKEVCLTRELVIVLESKPDSSIPENEGEYTYVGFSHPYEVTNTRSLEVFMDEYDGFCFNLSSTRALKQVACRMYGNQKIKAILDDYEHANSVSKYDTERINIHIYGTKYEIHKFDISIQKTAHAPKITILDGYNHHATWPLPVFQAVLLALWAVDDISEEDY